MLKGNQFSTKLLFVLLSSDMVLFLVIYLVIIILLVFAHSFLTFRVLRRKPSTEVNKNSSTAALRSLTIFLIAIGLVSEWVEVVVFVP